MDNSHTRTSHLVGLTKHGKEEVKFVNCTEIHAVHFRGQLGYQTILIMQIPSPGGWFPVVHRAPVAASASPRPLARRGSTRCQAGGAGLLELRDCGAPPRAPWAPGEGGRRRHGSGIWPCFCPWPCHKAEKERGLHTEGFTFLLLGKHSPEHGISETSGPSRGQGPRCAEFPGSSLPTSLRSPPLSSAPTAERGGGGAVLGGRISTYDFWRGHKHSDCSKSTYYVPGNLCDTEDMAVLT